MKSFSGGYYEPLQDTLYDGMRAILDSLNYNTVDVVFSKTNSIESLNTYCVLDILQIKQEGKRDEGSFIVPEGEWLEFNTYYNIYLQVSVFGDKAGEVATALHHHFNNRRCFEELAKRNLGLLKKTDLRRNPQLRETKWVDSFNFDTNLTFSIFTKQSFDWVEYITVNGEVFKVPYKE